MCKQVWEPVTGTRGNIVRSKLLHPVQKNISLPFSRFLSSLLKNRLPVDQTSRAVTFTPGLEFRKCKTKENPYHPNTVL